MIRLVLQYCQFHYVGISRFQEESILLIIPNANRNGFLVSQVFYANDCSSDKVYI